LLIHFTGTFIRQAKQIKDTQVLNKQQKAKEALFLKEKRQSNKSLVILHDTLPKKTHDLNLVEANHAYHISGVVTGARRKERSHYASVL